ncbi:MAG: NeuD/PglB/VioB family sugar acetyltransferase [Anaerolineales bacterium]
MPEAVAVTIPLLNPNEPEVMLSALSVAQGDIVQKGDALATVETTKSSTEIAAERAGTVVGLRAAVGTTLAAGDVLLWLADDSSWQPPAKPQSDQPAPADALRMTEAARELARKEGVDLESMPVGPLITESWLRDRLAAQEKLPEIDPFKLLVYGAGGHGKSVIELVYAVGGYELIGVIDDGIAAGTQILDLEVLGAADRLQGLRHEGVGLAINAVGGIGDIRSRVRVFDRLAAAGFKFPTVVHPTAVVEPSAELAEGVQIFPQSYVGSQARLGFGVIVNTAAVVSHDCDVQDYANLAPGSLLAGAVTVGDRSLIGMGVTVNLEVTIGKLSRVGNSAVVKDDVPVHGVVPAGAVWPLLNGRQEGN